MPEARGEVFFGPSNETNRVIIPENAAFIISAVLGDAMSSPVSGIYVVSEGTGQVLLRSNAGDPNIALAGPAELIINTAGVITYKVLHGTPIRSIVAPPGSTNILEIPAGKTAKFFNPIVASPGGSTSPARANVSLKKGEATFRTGIAGGEEFSGPITLDFSASQFQMDSAIISYYFTEDFVVAPNLGLLQGPTGTFEVLIDKSVNLQSWFPVVAHHTGSDQKAFYRIRMNK